MESLIDKIKSFIDKTDKKVLIGIGAGIVCLIVAIIVVVAVVACGGDDTESPASGKSTAQSTTEVTAKDETSTKKDDGSTSESDETTSGEESSLEETSSDESSSEETTTKKNNQTTSQKTTTTQNTTTSTVVEETTTLAPAGGEAGTEHREIPDANLSVTTVEIAPGKSVYYEIQRVAGKIFEISSPDAYVVYDGQKYTASNGVVSFRVDPSGLASDYVRFEIGNTSSSKKSFKIQLKTVVGTQEKPEEITSLSGTRSVHLEKGNDKGYNYTYIAERDGDFSFYVKSVDPSKVSAGISVSAIGANDIVVNRDTNADAIDDGQGNKKITMTLTKGQKVNIVVYVLPDARNRYLEATVTWVAE